MVGVPHSTGCRTCLVRKVKCDEARPRCFRCSKSGTQCPGYNRPLAFRYQTQSNPTRTQAREPIDPCPRTITRKHPHRPVLIPRPSIDETLAPNLAYEALSTQTRESFYEWLMYYFPRNYSSFASRVDTNWMDYLRQLSPTSCPQALMWGLRALITFQMGTLQGNDHAIRCARHFYGRGINHLRSLLQSRVALSDGCLASCILLGGYEILDSSSEQAWISHMRGIRHIMSLRGAAQHKSGMGRTLLLSFRPYLVAESFLLGEPCFLGHPNWTAMTDDIFLDEERRGTSTPLGQILDLVFNEVAKCPGYYATTRAILQSQADPSPSITNVLLDDMAIAKSRLSELRSQIDISTKGDLQCAPQSFLGSIPSQFADSMTQLSCNGINSAQALLDQLLTVIEADRKRRQILRQTSLADGFENTNSKDPWRASAEKISMGNESRPLELSCDPTLITSSSRPIGDALDQFSMVMGIMNISTGRTTPEMEPMQNSRPS